MHIVSGCEEKRKCSAYYSAALTAFAAFSVSGQGTLVYDQQSGPENNPGEWAWTIQQLAPTGQSFTPSLTTIGFVRLYLGDDAFDGLGGTVLVNLRRNSITGPLLASTESVFMPDRFVGPTNFLFQSSVPLTPGDLYVLEIIVQSANNWHVDGDLNFRYAGGYFDCPRGP